MANQIGVNCQPKLEVCNSVILLDFQVFVNKYLFDYFILFSNIFFHDCILFVNKENMHYSCCICRAFPLCATSHDWSLLELLPFNGISFHRMKDPFFCVNSFMLFPPSVFSKGFLTVTTFEMPFTCVSPLMSCFVS